MHCGVLLAYDEGGSEEGDFIVGVSDTHSHHAKEYGVEQGALEQDLRNPFFFIHSFNHFFFCLFVFLHGARLPPHLHPHTHTHTHTQSIS